MVVIDLRFVLKKNWYVNLSPGYIGFDVEASSRVHLCKGKTHIFLKLNTTEMAYHVLCL